MLSKKRGSFVFFWILLQAGGKKKGRPESGKKGGDVSSGLRSNRPQQNTGVTKTRRCGQARKREEVFQGTHWRVPKSLISGERHTIQKTHPAGDGRFCGEGAYKDLKKPQPKEKRDWVCPENNENQKKTDRRNLCWEERGKIDARKGGAATRKTSLTKG